MTGFVDAFVGAFGRIIGWLCAASLWLSASGCAVPQPRGEGKLSRLIEPTTGRAYWLYLPKDLVKTPGAGRPARRRPLVVTFHGMKPFDNSHRQAREWEREADRYGYVVVAPELRSIDLLGQFPVRTIDPVFQSDETATLAILDHVIATTGVDPENILATSWSSGGYMAHYMLNRHPDRITCLAVRQSNFSERVLDPEAATRSRNHPILIVNTENDFAVCKHDSKEALDWYKKHSYRNVTWLCLKDLGHERTPAPAADFFASVAGVTQKRRPEVVVRGQVTDGDPGRAYGRAWRQSQTRLPGFAVGVQQ